MLQYGKVYYQDKVGAQYNQTGDGLWTGHSKVYGSFRNLQLYDLELNVRRDIKKLNLNKHKGDIRRIRRGYKQSFVDEVSPLMSGLDSEIFETTFLLYKLSPLTFKERMRKLFLYLKTDYVFYEFLFIHRFKKYILRKSNTD